MLYEIVVPQLGVNDEVVKIVEWHVKDRGKVHIGSPLCSVETSKALFEMSAEYEGFVRMRKGVGEEVKIKEVIGYIADSPNAEIEGLRVNNGIVSRKAARKATERAKALAESLGVDLNMIRKDGIIREKDVREFYQANSKNGRPIQKD